MLREVDKLLGSDATDCVFGWGDPRNGAESYAHQPESARLRVRALVTQASEVVCVGTDPVATITTTSAVYATRAPEPARIERFRVRMWCCPESATSDCRSDEEAHDWIACHMTQCRGDL